MGTTIEKHKKVPELRFSDFNANWEIKRIQSLIDDGAITSHLDGNHGGLYPRAEEFTPDGVPYITANDFADGHVRFDRCKRLPPERAAQFRKGVAKNGDVLFAHNATVGPTAVLETDLDYVILSTTATYFRCDPKQLNNSYLQKYFQSDDFVSQYSRIMFQSTRSQVPITAQRKLFVSLPSIEEQQKISDFLGSVDVWLDNLRQQKTALETYKRGLMQKLFTQQVRFKDDSGNNFPEWMENEVGNHAEIYQPQTISQSVMDDSAEFSVWGANGIVGKYKEFNHDLPQVIVTCRGSTCGTVNITGPKVWITGNAMVFNVDNNKEIVKEFLYYRLKNDNLNYLISGSGQPQITGNIRHHKIKFPTKDEQQKIADFLTSIDQAITVKSEEIAKVEQWKKGLMQKMFV